MKLNSVSLQTKPQQNFGKLIVTPETIETISKEIFLDNKKLIDEFKKTIFEVAKEQKNNKYFDIQLFQGYFLPAQNTYPTIRLQNKAGGKIFEFNSLSDKYYPMSEEKATIEMIKDANRYTPRHIEMYWKKQAKNILSKPKPNTMYLDPIKDGVYLNVSV